MLISPKYDGFVKEMFYNEIVRRHFVGDILGIEQDKIDSVYLKNTFLRKRWKKQKLGILDLVVVLNDRTKINIELQVKAVRDWDKRQLFYLCKLYTEDILSGEDYTKLKRCIGISILDFNLTEGKEYHSVYRFRDNRGNEFSEMLEIHVIELRKELTGQGEVDDWISFFNVKTEEDLKMLTMRTKNPGILEAVRELKRMSMNNPLRLWHEAHLKQVRDQRARDGYVWERGIEKGEQQLAALMERLLADGRMEDAKRAVADEQARKDLYRELGITGESGDDLDVLCADESFFIRK
jgi:predicted transposase/invertase (TIGR01784 family)